MAQLVRAYKITCPLEIILTGALMTWTFASLRPTNKQYLSTGFERFMGDIIFFLLLLLPFFFSIQLINGTKNLKTKSESFIIFAHISNSLKLLLTIGFIFFQYFLFQDTYSNIEIANSRGQIYTLTFIALLMWDIFSIFNFFALFQIVKENRKIKLPEIDQTQV